MELTQQDYDTRKARVNAGEGDDEDARLVKHYEREGFTTAPAPPPAGDSDEPGEGTGNADGGTGNDTLAVDKAGRRPKAGGTR